jgi:succinyl-CoA synthetase alpha subunit
MGHAGAIISGGQGTASEKYAALRSAGIHTVQSPAEIGQAVAAVIDRGTKVDRRSPVKKKTSRRQKKLRDERQLAPASKD